MSLLNDALRKKNREGKISTPKIALFNKPHEKKSVKLKHKRIILPVLIILLILIGLWQFFPSSMQPAKNDSLWKGPAPEKEIQGEMAKKAVLPENRKGVGLSSADSDKEENHGTTVLKNQIEAPDNKNTPKKEQKNKPLPVIPEPSHVLRSQTVSSENPEKPFYDKATNFHKQGKLNDAIILYLEVLQKNPQHDDALFDLASAYIEVSAYQKALSYLEELLARRPMDPKVLLNIAVAEIGLGNYEEALSYLKKTENLNDPPSAYGIYFHRGIALSKLGQYKEAITGFKKAEGLHVDNPRLLFNMAITYDKDQKYDEALLYYEKYLEMANDIPGSERITLENRIRILDRYAADSPIQMQKGEK